MPDLATRDDVARLFGRAAFGATAADLDTWTGQPYDAMVDSLFPPGPPGTVGRTPQPDEAVRLELEHGTTDVASAERWWIERMRTTPYPLEERMTLFWHDHWATSYSGQPDVGQMAIQNQTLRTHALGSFREMAYAMLVDPALLIWLNGIQNVVNGVNENLAREFFELFTLGVNPQVYTETDIRQAAKALTGFTVNTTTRAATFTAARHDITVKHVLGRTIGGYPSADTRNTVEYKEVADAALAQNYGITASRFVAYKIALELGYTPDVADLLIDDVAWEIRAGDRWDLRAGVRMLLTHPRWRYADPSAGQHLVRSPIEVAVHGAKVLGVNCGIVNNGLQSGNAATGATRAGQEPFRPPNVGGWPNALNWLSQTTMLGRYDLGVSLVAAYKAQHADQLIKMPASADVDGWTKFMGLARLTTNTALRIREYLASPGTTVEADKQTSMFVLLGASPDWQVM
jgi:uncharacterized protein (DUF1800 family)